jgi:signal peptidase I
MTDGQERTEDGEPCAQGVKPPKRKKSVFREYAEAFAAAVLLALFIRAFVVQAFKIPSGSMLPTLLVGDHLLVTKFVYGVDLPFVDGKVMAFKTPERKDIIVFKYPEDPTRDFIKRVVGVAGDRVEVRSKRLYVNGEPLEVENAMFTDPTVRPADVDRRDNFGPVTVPEGKVFVMGDNRDNSHDSRYWGFVDVSEIRGKALVIYWSWDSDGSRPRFGRMGRMVE